MAVPRKKTSRMKRGTRRSADALAAPVYVEDKESGDEPVKAPAIVVCGRHECIYTYMSNETARRAVPRARPPPPPHAGNERLG